MSRCTITKNQRQETGYIRGYTKCCNWQQPFRRLNVMYITNSGMGGSVCILLGFICSSLIRDLRFFLPRKYSFGSMEQDIMCAITLWLWALFRSRTLPESMIAIEASEANFLFSYLFCSLSSILILKNSTTPQCMTTLTQNARRKFRLILSLTSYLAIGCKNFGCFRLNWFLVFCLRVE